MATRSYGEDPKVTFAPARFLAVLGMTEVEWATQFGLKALVDPKAVLLEAARRAGLVEKKP